MESAGKILIADDEEIVHLTLKRLLEPEGYAIDSAYGGKEALDRLAAGYDLLILDIRMTDMDGIEVLREVRRREIDIEVIILTGFATIESATQAMNYGARSYIMKPIENVPEFRNSVREGVHMARLAHENKRFYDALISDQADSFVIDSKSYQMLDLREEIREIFKRLMEVIRDAIVFVDFDGRIKFTNLNFTQMIGESYQNLLGKEFELYIEKEDQDKIVDVFTRLASGHVAVSIRTRLKTNFGRILSVTINASPMYYKMEYHGIVMLISNVTETDAVKRKAELLANLVENAQYDMMFVVRPDGQIIECNSLARSSFGYAQSETLKLNIMSLLKSETYDAWEKIVDSIEQDPHRQREIMAITKDGKEFPIELTVSIPGRGAIEWEGNPAFLITMRDITGRKRAEEIEAEAREKAARIEHLEEELRSLAGLSNVPQTSVTARMYGVVTLLEGFPDTFNELVGHYKELMDLALEQHVFKVKHDISGRLSAISETLGFYRAGPRDVVDIHAAALKEKIRMADTGEKKKAYTGEGWIMVLELMGHLTSFYRNRAYSGSMPPNNKEEKMDMDKAGKEDGNG